MTDIKKMAEVKPLTAPVSTVIEVLEELLERAKAGDLKSIAVCYTTKAGNVGNTWATGPYTSIYLGCAVAMLSHDYIQAMSESEATGTLDPCS